MAEGNYGALIFKNDGLISMDKFEDGLFVNASNNRIQIHKNWLDIQTKPVRAKKYSRDFERPVIGTFQLGRARIADFSIEAIRGPQCSIFFQIQWWDAAGKIAYGGGIAGEIYRWIYLDEAFRRIGIDPKTKNLKEWTMRSGSQGGILYHYPSKEKIFLPFENWEYTGIKKSTCKKYLAWLQKLASHSLASDEFKVWVSLCKRSAHAYYIEVAKEERDEEQKTSAKGGSAFGGKKAQTAICL